MDKKKIKFRRTWNINPETKIKDSAKGYQRAENKEIVKNLKNIDLANIDLEEFEEMMEDE